MQPWSDGCDFKKPAPLFMTGSQEPSIGLIPLPREGRVEVPLTGL